MQRRTFIATISALTVAAFDPTRRSWLTAAEAAYPQAIPVPELDGELTVDPEALAEAADDFGHIVSRAPIAVLRPASVKDIVKLVKYANRNGVKVAMRGQGHSTYGQAQVAGGIVIDSRTLAAIHEIEDDRVTVDAGVTWNALLAATLARDLTPPVLTDYLDLSIGGTLSVGGIGGATHRKGMQVDNALALDVVTGDGRLVQCSGRRNRALFEAVLGGLGQYGIIVGATLALERAKKNARVYRLYYADLDQYVADQTFLAEDARFDYLEGQVLPNGAGGFQYMVEAAVWFSPASRRSAPDDASLLADLSFDTSSIEDLTYDGWLRRLEPTVAFLQQIGVWAFPHPWIDLLVPASEAADIARLALASVSPDTQDPMLFYPFPRRKLTRPLFMVPDEPVIFLFDILRTAPPIPGVADSLVQLNRSIYDAAAALGAKKYPISSIPFAVSDWQAHYGPQWAKVQVLKQAFDRNHTLTPGQGIFA
ncbi:FAD-binding protein [Methylolobus aquaticus]|nr:FAD-binding protein [Methylolobus aquaticus]